MHSSHPFHILNILHVLPYRTKFRRTKVPKIWLCAENFVRQKILSAQNFVRRNVLFQLHQMVENMMEKRITTK